MPRACRILLEACKDPVTWDILKKTKDLKKEVFEVLITLNKTGAIGFDKIGKKYYATDDGIDALNAFSKDG